MSKKKKIKKSDRYALSPFFLEKMFKPVDAEIFKFVSTAYSAAAQMTMPVENPASRPVAELDGKLLSFTDIPINRGMLAAKKQLIEINAQDHEAYLCRLMHFGEILKSRSRFGDLIKDDNESGALMVSEAVMFAAATARLRLDKEEYMGYDIDDVIRVAQEYAKTHSEEIAL